MQPYYDEGGITIYHADCLDVLPNLPSAGLVVTDPPYTFGLASIANGKSGTWADLMNNAYWYAEWLKEIRRLTENQQGAAWVFHSWRTMPVLMRAVESIQWAITSNLIWDKCWIGPGGPQGLRPSYEMVALLCHGDFSLGNRGLPDIWKSKWSSHKQTGHPAEKPVALIGKMIAESGGSGVVLDPFMGSGTTLLAAKQGARSAIGIEAEERYCEMAVKRLAQGELFA